MAPGTTFQYVLQDPLAEREPSKVSQVVLCSGKHYYTLDKYRKEHKRTDVAIVRVEVSGQSSLTPAHDILSIIIFLAPLSP